ncbi:hypothetical protein K2X33_08715, partial [bacterium]|nr:hypothetical protein [bacterium]
AKESAAPATASLAGIPNPKRDGLLAYVAGGSGVQTTGSQKTNPLGEMPQQNGTENQDTNGGWVSRRKQVTAVGRAERAANAYGTASEGNGSPVSGGSSNELYASADSSDSADRGIASVPQSAPIEIPEPSVAALNQTDLDLLISGLPAKQQEPLLTLVQPPSVGERPAVETVGYNNPEGLGLMNTVRGFTKTTKMDPKPLTNAVAQDQKLPALTSGLTPTI